MKREFNVIIEKDEDGYYVATVPSLKGCHTQAKSLDDLMKRTKEAIELCLEEESNPIYQYDFVGVQKITINEPPANYDGSAPKESESIQNTARTTHRTVSGKKLYAVRDKKGSFVDIQTYKKAHAADLRRKSKKGKGK